MPPRAIQESKISEMAQFIADLENEVLGKEGYGDYPDSAFSEHAHIDMYEAAGGYDGTTSLDAGAPEERGYDASAFEDTLMAMPNFRRSNPYAR
jgi:hypothetical protein